MISRAYERVISEHFNILDDNTRSTLLMIDEADQNKVLESLTSKLYQSIVDKADDIDFGSIPNSKGDTTQIQNYDQLLECIGVIKDILIEYRQDLDPINTIMDAISNVQSRIDTWRKAFSMKVEFPILIYNTIVLSIVSSVSLIIATSIEFIKDAGDAAYSIKFDKVSYVKSKDGLLFDNLKKFNVSCRSGELDTSLDHIFEGNRKQFTGLEVITVVSIVGVIGIITNIIPILRELVFFFYNSKQKISDYFAIQADLLQINAEYVKGNPNLNLSASERKDVVKKQNNIVDTFRKISNTFAIDTKTSESKSKKDSEANQKKYNIEDIVDGKLDSADTENISSIF
jgi:hypothetical protein